MQIKEAMYKIAVSFITRPQHELQANMNSTVTGEGSLFPKWIS